MGCKPCQARAAGKTAKQWEIRDPSGKVIDTKKTLGGAQIVAASNPGSTIHPIST